MEFVAGATLKELLVNGPLPFSEVLRLGKQMMQGLAAAHQAQLVHRDIKPANLKVTPGGELKILDFGLAQLLPSASVRSTRELTTRSHLELGWAGTMPYMSPEQLCGELATERSDIFSAGAVLYEMATAGRRSHRPGWRCSSKPSFTSSRLGRRVSTREYQRRLITWSNER
jgi:serine/threonine protein kinase